MTNELVIYFRQVALWHGHRYACGWRCCIGASITHHFINRHLIRVTLMMRRWLLALLMWIDWNRTRLLWRLSKIVTAICSLMSLHEGSIYQRLNIFLTVIYLTRCIVTSVTIVVMIRATLIKITSHLREHLLLWSHAW